MKIFLTGGNGFIGKNIQESFLAQKYEITAPRSYELNLIDTASVDAFFKNKTFDVVIHAAVKPGHRNAKDPTDLFYSNTKIFENLVRHKDKYARFINLGSGAIYDNSQNITDVKESETFKKIPCDEHGFSKYVIAKRIETLDNFYDLNIFGIFGKYEDYAIRFISNAICKAICGLPITLRQNRKFSYLYIDDLMPILEFFIDNTPKFKSYNAVPDEKYELLRLAEIIGQNTAIQIAKTGYGFDYTASNERLKSEIPKLKFTRIENSIENLYNYYSQLKDTLDKTCLLTDK